MERAAASWWRGQRRGGEGSGLEAWRFQRDRGRLRGRESGGVVVEGAAAWRRRQWLGGLEIST